MKAIILLVCRSRFVVPRVGNFIHNNDFAAVCHPHKPFIFEGRALDVDEFNAAAARLLDVRNPSLGYEVTVRLISDEEFARMAEEREATALAQAEALAASQAAADSEPVVESEPASDTEDEFGIDNDEEALTGASSEPEPSFDPPLTPEEEADQQNPPPRFRIVGTDIFEGEVRVGGLFEPGPHLRVASGRSDLRDELKAWLATNPQ